MGGAQVTQPPITPEPHSVWSFRLFLVCLAALSVSLPMAWISLAKVLLFVFALVYLIANHSNSQSDPVFDGLWTPRIVLAILFAFSLSLLWTSVDMQLAVVSLVKHGKLLEIVLLISLIRTGREARIGITVFVAGQAFLLFSSWLLVAGVPIPWNTVTRNLHAWSTKHVVFSSYLDQSIIFATMAAIFWHLRSDQLWPRWLGGLLAGATLINVFLLLEARTGYAVALTMLCLTAMWAMQKRLRLSVVIAAPVIVLLGFFLELPQIHDRLSMLVYESENYANQGEHESSSGWRLNAWYRSVQAIQEQPLAGHGVGSWTQTVKRLEGNSTKDPFGAGQASNPHQEYLLWGVELGVAGTLLLLSLMLGVVRDAQRFKTSIKRATISVTAAAAVACLFNSTLYDALIGDFFCITLGLLMAQGLRTEPGRSGPAIPATDLVHLKTIT